MNRYENPMPRAALMFAAVAITLLTLCLTVFAPTTVDSGGFEARVLAGPKSEASEPIEVVLSPSKIEVYGVREQNTAYEPVRNNAPKRKHAG